MQRQGYPPWPLFLTLGITGIALAVTALFIAISAIDKGSQTETVFLDIDFRTTDLDLVDTFGYLDTVPASTGYSVIKKGQFSADAANDGNFTRDPIRGLVIDSSPFTTRGASVFDHTKFLVLTQNSYSVNTPGEVMSLEAMISMYTTGIINASALPGDSVLNTPLQKYEEGVANASDDPRLACAALNLLDLEHGMVYDFIITNKTIFALYEHLPFTTDTAIFTYAIPVGKRPTDVNTFNTLRIDYETSSNQISWHIDGKEVFRVVQPGMPLPNPEYLVFMANDTSPEYNPVESTEFSAGFGTFSLLDFLPFWGTYDNAGYNRYYNQTLNGINPISTLSNLPPLFPTDGPSLLRTPDANGELVSVSAIAHIINPIGPLPDDGQGAMQTIQHIKLFSHSH